MASAKGLRVTPLPGFNDTWLTDRPREANHCPSSPKELPASITNSLGRGRWIAITWASMAITEADLPAPVGPQDQHMGIFWRSAGLRGSKNIGSPPRLNSAIPGWPVPRRARRSTTGWPYAAPG